jgi:hypothetical protein
VALLFAMYISLPCVFSFIFSVCFSLPCVFLRFSRAYFSACVFARFYRALFLCVPSYAMFSAFWRTTKKRLYDNVEDGLNEGGERREHNRNKRECHTELVRRGGNKWMRNT